MDKQILEQLISHSDSNKMYSELIERIKKVLIPLLNKTIIQRPDMLTEFGKGKIGYSLNQENLFYKLRFLYDAGNDVFLIKYKALNSIVNDLELEIMVEEDSFPELITSNMKKIAIEQFEYKV